MSKSPEERDSSDSEQPVSWFRFSLKSMLLVTALVAAYLGGRASTQPHWYAPEAGTWQLTMKSGHQRTITLTSLPDNSLLLDMGSNSTLGGKYRWKTGQLIVDTPDDTRYTGLVWKWQGDDLVLIAEPPSHPAGPSYVGARMKFVSSEIQKPQAKTKGTPAQPVVERKTKRD